MTTSTTEEPTTEGSRVRRAGGGDKDTGTGMGENDKNNNKNDDKNNGKNDNGMGGGDGGAKNGDKPADTAAATTITTKAADVQYSYCM